jgi:hypothetical protein
MRRRNALIMLASAALATGGGVALGQATSDPQRDCPGPTLTGIAAEQAREAYAKLPPLPEGMQAGSCNYGAGTVR